MVNPESLHKSAESNALTALEKAQKLEQKLFMISMRVQTLEGINEGRDKFDEFLRDEFGKLSGLGANLETLLSVAVAWKFLEKFPGGQLGALVLIVFAAVFLENKIFEIVF